MKKDHRSERRGRSKKKRGFPFYIILVFVLSGVLFLLSIGSLFLYFSYNLPDYAPLKERRETSHSIIYAEDDDVIGKFLMENRIPVPFERIPKHLVHAFVAAEDAEFFQHKGIDY